MRKATRPPHPRPHLRALRLLRARAGGLRLLRARAGGLRLALAAPAALSALLAVGLFSTGAAARTKPFKLPRIRHVFVIMLENEGYEATFGMPASDPYLAKTLPSEGALLTQYYATGHESNDNYVTLVSGQPPNPDNQADCQDFSAFPLADVNSEGVQEGIGCVYPQEVQNVGTQLSAAKKSWKAYMEDMGNDPNREAAACGHPGLGEQDHTQEAVEGDGYATRHDPFVYFESVIGQQSYCDSHVVALGSPSGQMPAAALKGETGLATDLKKASSTPDFAFITPNLCDDGHDFPCKNQKGGASALADIDSFLETWVPLITGSPAFKKGGLLEIVFDEASSSETSACCEEKAGKASPEPGIGGPGGGRIGAVLISPFIKPGTVSATPYNHYSSLASWEAFFGLPRLAYAASVPSVFGADVFTAAR